MERERGASKCSVHPDLVARREPCRRCGNFTCEACFEHPDHHLCLACSDATGQLAADLAVSERSRAYRRWVRKNPRLGGLVTMLAGMGAIALNFALIIWMERYYFVLFPLGGAAIGLGLATVLTGRAGFAGRGQAPLSYRVTAGGLSLLGLAGGLYLNFLTV